MRSGPGVPAAAHEAVVTSLRAPAVEPVRWTGMARVPRLPAMGQPQKSSDSPLAAPQRPSAGQSLAVSPSSSTSFAHAGAAAGPASELQAGYGQPGSFGTSGLPSRSLSM